MRDRRPHHSRHTTPQTDDGAKNADRNLVANTQQTPATHTPQTSVSSGAPNAFIESSPTLGTIVGNSPSDQARSTPGQFGPSGRPFASAASTLNTINTGSTPLSLTPGGSATPIRLTIHELQVAASRNEGASSWSGPARQSRTHDTPTTAGAQRGPQSPRDTTGKQAEAAPKTPEKHHQRKGHKVGSSETPFGAGKMAPAAGATTVVVTKNTATESSKVTVGATPTTGAPEPTGGSEWGYYLFLGIFLLVLLVLILTLMLTKSG